MQAAANQHQIVHLKIAVAGSLPDFLRIHLNLSTERINELIHLGCIYKNDKRLNAASASRENAASASNELQIGDLLRVHQNPRRFKKELLSYPECLIYECPDFIIINKPSGLPVPPTVDNAQENLVKLLSDIRNEQLHVTHRLDIATSGLIFFARTKAAQKDFNLLLANREIKKLYRAYVSGQFSYPRDKIMIHYMAPSPKAPKKVSREAHPNWAECKLKVLGTSYHSEGNQTELEIELLTGRTHQIRAQLSAEAYPIVGDRLYGDTHTLAHDHELILLQSHYLSFTWDNENLKFKLPQTKIGQIKMSNAKKINRMEN